MTENEKKVNFCLREISNLAKACKEACKQGRACGDEHQKLMEIKRRLIQVGAECNE